MWLSSLCDPSLCLLHRRERAKLMLFFAEAIGIRAKGQINRFIFQIFPIFTLIKVRARLRINKGRHIPGFLIGQLRAFVGRAEWHIVFYKTRQVANAVHTGAIVIAMLAPERRIGVSSFISRRHDFAISPMANFAFGHINNLALSRVSSGGQIRQLFGGRAF